MYSVYIRFWPTLTTSNVRGGAPLRCADCPWFCERRSGPQRTPECMQLNVRASKSFVCPCELQACIVQVCRVVLNTGTQVSATAANKEHLGIRIWMYVRLSCVCMCVCVCVWVCMCVGVYVCGCVGVWVCPFELQARLVSSASVCTWNRYTGERHCGPQRTPDCARFHLRVSKLCGSVAKVQVCMCPLYNLCAPHPNTHVCAHFWLRVIYTGTQASVKLSSRACYCMPSLVKKSVTEWGHGIFGLLHGCKLLTNISETLPHFSSYLRRNLQFAAYLSSEKFLVICYLPTQDPALL